VLDNYCSGVVMRKAKFFKRLDVRQGIVGLDHGFFDAQQRRQRGGPNKAR